MKCSNDYVIFACILHDPILFHENIIQATHSYDGLLALLHFNYAVNIFVSPAQFADNGLGCFTQVRWILEHPVQNLGINLLRL